MSIDQARRTCLQLAAFVGIVLAVTCNAGAAQPSHAEAAQQMAAQTGVSPDEIEILSITFAGTEVRGNEIVELWNIQYRINQRAEQPSPVLPSAAQDPTQSAASSIWPLGSEIGDVEASVPVSTSTHDPLALPPESQVGHRDAGRLNLGLAIGICVLVFVGLGGVVIWQVVVVRAARQNGNATGPPPIGRRP